MNTPNNLKQQFFNALKRGTGEAYLIVKKNPTIDFSNYIIKGALKNYAYDGQCESSRATYLTDIISLTNQQDKILSAVLKGLATEKEDTWTLTQLFDLAKMFAEEGNSTAKKAIYKRFFRKIINGSSWAGYSAIIHLDGFEGLKYIASTIGKSLEKNPDDWQDDNIISYCQEQYPLIDVLKELKKAGKQNKYIQIYLNIIKRTEQRQKKYQKQQPVKDFKTLFDEIGSYKRSYFRLRLRKLTDAEIELLATHFLNETDKFKKGQFLGVFAKHKYPFDYQPLLVLANGKANNKDRLVEFAIEALKNIQGKDIRAFALDKLQRTSKPAQYTDLLISNYKKGDATLLISIAEKFHNEYTIESLAISYTDIFTANKTKACKEPLEILYYKTNCSICRESIVKILLENDVLSKKIKEEIKYDCNLDTRMLS